MPIHDRGEVIIIPAHYVNQLVHALNRHGIDSSALLEQLAIHPQRLRGLSGSVSPLQMTNLIQHSAQLLDDEMLGFFAIPTRPGLPFFCSATCWIATVCLNIWRRVLNLSVSFCRHSICLCRGSKTTQYWNYAKSAPIPTRITAQWNCFSAFSCVWPIGLSTKKFVFYEQNFPIPNLFTAGITTHYLTAPAILISRQSG